MVAGSGDKILWQFLPRNKMRSLHSVHSVHSVLTTGISWTGWWLSGWW